MVFLRASPPSISYDGTWGREYSSSLRMRIFHVDLPSKRMPTMPWSSLWKHLTLWHTLTTVMYEVWSDTPFPATAKQNWMARAFLQKTLDIDIDQCWFLFPGAQGPMTTWLNYEWWRWPYFSALSLLKVWDMTNCDVCTHMIESGIHIMARPSLGVTSHGWSLTRTLIDLKGLMAYHKEHSFLAKLNEDSWNHRPSAGSAHLRYKHCGANIG